MRIQFKPSPDDHSVLAAQELQDFVADMMKYGDLTYAPNAEMFDEDEQAQVYVSVGRFLLAKGLDMTAIRYTLSNLYEAGQ